MQDYGDEMKTDSDLKIAKKIKETVNLEDKAVLEIGCGNGRVTSLIYTPSCHLTAIDIAENAIAEASQRNKSIKFLVGSGENLNFKKNSFDIVIFTLSLHHQNSKKALSEAHRVLKGGGEVIVIEPAEEGEIERLLSFLINENQAKKEAQRAILNCDLAITHEQMFTAEWIFDDLEDLQRSPFSYYSMSYDPQIAKKLVEFAGIKDLSAPIFLEDLMTIQVLS